MEPRILVGLPTSLIRREFGDRRYAIYVRPAYRILYQGDELYEFEVWILEGITRSWIRLRTLPWKLTHRARDFRAIRKLYRIRRRIWSFIANDFQADGFLAKSIALAFVAFISCWIVLGWPPSKW